MAVSEQVFHRLFKIIFYQFNTFTGADKTVYVILIIGFHTIGCAVRVHEPGF